MRYLVTLALLIMGYSFVLADSEAPKNLPDELAFFKYYEDQTVKIPKKKKAKKLAKLIIDSGMVDYYDHAFPSNQIYWLTNEDKNREKLESLFDKVNDEVNKLLDEDYEGPGEFFKLGESFVPGGKDISGMLDPPKETDEQKAIKGDHGPAVINVGRQPAVLEGIVLDGGKKTIKKDLALEYIQNSCKVTDEPTDFPKDLEVIVGQAAPQMIQILDDERENMKFRKEVYCALLRYYEKHDMDVLLLEIYPRMPGKEVHCTQDGLVK